MKKNELIEKLEEIIERFKEEKDSDTPFYGGKIILYEEREDDYVVSLRNIDMSINVDAMILADVEDCMFTEFMEEVYRYKSEKMKESLKKEDDNEED